MKDPFYFQLILKYLIVLVFIALSYLLCIIIIKVADKKAMKVIRSGKCKTAMETVLIRGWIGVRRKRIVKCVLAIVSVIVSTVITLDINIPLLGRIFIGLLIFLFVFGLLGKPAEELSFLARYAYGHISTKTIEDVLKEEHYNLYLRGFALDDNSLIEPRDEYEKYTKGFSEYFFVKGIRGQAGDVYTIGNPLEADCPYGATRIYLDPGPDSGWEKDVERLIDNADAVYVLVTCTESCLKELQFALSKPDKTFLLVDDIEEYEKVQRSGFHQLPRLEAKTGWFVYELKYERLKGKWTVGRFKKTRKGYVEMTNPKDSGTPSLLYRVINGIQRRVYSIKYLISGILALLIPIVFLDNKLTQLKKNLKEDIRINTYKSWTLHDWSEHLNSSCPVMTTYGIGVLGSSAQDSLFIIKIALPETAISEKEELRDKAKDNNYVSEFKQLAERNVMSWLKISLFELMMSDAGVRLFSESLEKEGKVLEYQYYSSDGKKLIRESELRDCLSYSYYKEIQRDRESKRPVMRDIRAH